MSEADTTPSPEYLAQYNGGTLMGLSIAFIPIAIIFTGLRFFARHLSRATFGLDDCLALVSLALSLGVSALAMCFVIYGGVGRHTQYWMLTDPNKIETYFKYLFTVSTYYFLPITIPKLSILAFYDRIFVTKPYRIAIRVLAGIIIANAIVSLVVSFNLCRPLPYYWDRSIPNGHCYNQQLYYTWSGFPNILTDLAMIILPLPPVWNLNTSASVKMGLTGAFLTGGLGLVGSIMKFVMLFRYNAIKDGTWQSTNLMIWGSVECYSYLLAACMVTFRPLIMFLLRDSKRETKTTVNARTTRVSLRYTHSRPRSHIAQLSRVSRTHWTDDDDGSRINGIAEVVVVVEAGSCAESEKSDLSPGKIYVSREWEVASSD